MYVRQETLRKIPLALATRLSSAMCKMDMKNPK